MATNNNNLDFLQSAYGQQLGSTGASQYYQPSQQQQVFGSQSLNMYGANSYGSVQQQQQPSVKGGRDMDSSLGLGGVQQQSGNSAVSSNKYGDASSVGVSSLGGLMNNSGSVGGNNSSNSTVTTNVLKNTLSASMFLNSDNRNLVAWNLMHLLHPAGKGVHSVPPGVGVQQQQQQQVLSTPLFMGNNMAIPYPYPYDIQFQARDHGGYPSAYGAAGKCFLFRLFYSCSNT